MKCPLVAARAASSLHHFPPSFISSGRHWEHSTTHLPPVNIARRLNYTHALTDTGTVSAKFPAMLEQRINVKSVGHSFIRAGECVCARVRVCVTLCVCYSDLSVHYYMVTFVAHRVCVMNCEHPVLMSSQWRPCDARGSIFSFNALISRFLNDGVIFGATDHKCT